MDDNRVLNIVAQLTPLINKGDINFEQNPFDITVGSDGASLILSLFRISKSDAVVPGFSSSVCATEEFLSKELAYSKLITHTHDSTMQKTWIDKNTVKKAGNDNTYVRFNILVTNVYEKILKVPIINLNRNNNDILLLSKPNPDNIHQNLTKPLCLLEADEAFYSVVVKETETFSLWDVAVFSPDFLKNNADRLLFVLYQLVSALNHCGTFGFLPMDLRLQAVSIDSNCWLRLDLGHCLAQVVENIDEFTETTSSKASLIHRSSQFATSHRPLWEWTQLWVSNQLSNFDYLTILNDFAGRRKCDPLYHPVFPWVVDFSCADGGFRDLSRSKYRLTKGDQQLDQTYCVSPDAHKNQVPHHVSEFLTDIGYFTYKARVTSKDLLCKHVRTKWVPEEYPSSMQRMYQWTPDECIPEFYSDSSIFESIHEDLSDLEYPAWCSSVDSFIEWHRKMLESDTVSSNLHNWIDLVFGYKLSGDAAVQAKNVQYHLCSNQNQLRKYGVLQLFDGPHPQKSSNIQIKFSHIPFVMSKGAQSVLNPLYEHEKLQRTSGAIGVESDNIVDLWRNLLKEQKEAKTQTILNNCMKSLTVFLIELCVPQYLHQLPREASLSQRRILADQCLKFKLSAIPRCLKSVLEYLASTNGSTTSPIEPDLISPGFLLQPVAQLVPFPFYTSILHDCLCKMKLMDDQFVRMKEATETIRNFENLRNLKENKVRTLAKTVPLLLPQMPPSAIEIMVHFVKELFEDPWTSVMAAWSLFNPVAEALGPALTQKYFVAPLLCLYDSELPCTSKHLKLYHRTFLLQIIVRIGTKEFLDNFVLPLIEAVAGERDKVCSTEDAYCKHLLGQQNHSVKQQVIFRKESRLRKEIPSCSDLTKSQSGIALQHMLRSSLPHASSELKIGVDSDSVQFDLDISDEGIQFGKGAADDGASIMSSSSMSSQQIQSEYEEDEEPDNVEPDVAQQTVADVPCISEVAKESLMWLAHRLGPLLTAKHLTRNLLRMLALCYTEDKLTSDTKPETNEPFLCNVFGDSYAGKVLSCLEHVAAIYGEQFIVRHYFAHCSDMVQMAGKRLNANIESSLIASIVVVQHMFPFLSDEHLMDNLKDHYFVDNIMYPVVRLVSSLRLCFSSTRIREVLVWKLLDCLYSLGIRAGGENVKNYLFVVLQRLMCTYDILYELNDGTVQCRTSADTEDSVLDQLREVFQPELANSAISLFRHLVGRQYLQLSLPNSELVSKVSQLRQSDNVAKETSPMQTVFNSATVGVKAFSGNRLTGLDPTSSSPQINRKVSDTFCKRLKNSIRQLRGNWLAYWEHELGRSDRDASFYFKQMKLITYVGHTNLIRRIYVMDNENSFVSASHDKTVKLWSLRSFGDGTCRAACQYTYRSHTKPLWDLTFVDSLRLIASTDGRIHIWDPFFGSILREFDSGDDQHFITTVKALTPPSKLVLAAGTSATIKFLDVRQAKWVHEYKLGSHAFGPVRGVAVDPQGNWVALGHGIGQLTVLDLRTGHFLASKKVADVDISLMEVTNKGAVIISVPEQPLLVWKMPQCTFSHKFPGPNETPACLTSYNNELLCCTQNNRLRAYTSVGSDASYSDSKLRSDIFSGNVSSMTVLPLNKLLLLGSTNGSIELLC